MRPNAVIYPLYPLYRLYLCILQPKMHIFFIGSTLESNSNTYFDVLCIKLCYERTFNLNSTLVLHTINIDLCTLQILMLFPGNSRENIFTFPGNSREPGKFQPLQNSLMNIIFVQKSPDFAKVFWPNINKYKSRCNPGFSGKIIYFSRFPGKIFGGNIKTLAKSLHCAHSLQYFILRTFRQ